ncbi:hypothetical protein MIND_01226400 [Mycena indigotica]|uniref:MYND-type domain-containing protein n=1 Tax=Mycena indigotica TaxID=2126181 RepID=A0A8H6VS59_9AGAR|nr:uncharacterized protein MIND_01226400 [Mycena indigotica]KAF7292007.1 hypothetical protein MIND_01226400 [Mycena indigotica]
MRLLKWKITLTVSLRSLRTLSSLLVQEDIDEEAYSEIWSRAWPWIEFLGQLTDPVTDAVNHSAYLRFIVAFSHREETVSVISITSGVGYLIGRAWAHALLQTKTITALFEVSLALIMVDDLYKFIDELVDGVGGSWDSLASIVMAHLYFVLDHGTDLKPEMSYISSGITAFLSEVLMNLDDFRDVLLRQGFVSVVIHITQARAVSLAGRNALGDDEFDPVKMLQELVACWISADRAPNSDQAQAIFIEAIQAGIFPTIFDCAALPDALNMELQFKAIFVCCIPPLTMRRLVLVELDAIFPELQRFDAVEYLSPQSLQMWRNFLAITAHNLNVLRWYNSVRNVPTLAACDNLGCAKVMARYELWCCAGCRNALYCGTACQKADYKRPQLGHKELCSYLQSYKSKNQSGNLDLKFLRAVVHYDYRTNEQEIGMLLLKFLHANPSTTPTVRFCLDYSTGRCSFSIEPLAMTEHIAPQRVQILRYFPWNEAIDQTSPSALKYAHSDFWDRVQLHMLEIRYPSDSLAANVPSPSRSPGPGLIFPFRVACPGLVIGLRSLVASLPVYDPSNRHTIDCDNHREVIRDLIAIEGLKTHYGH